MSLEAVLIRGDGVGPELIEVAAAAIARTGVEVAWREEIVGERTFADHGVSIQASSLAAIRECGAALKGPFTVPTSANYRSPNLFIRRELDLFACERPLLDARRGVKAILVRENTEDHYAAIEWEVGEDLAQALKVITGRASSRIAAYAFEACRSYGLNRVTAVHKANNLKLTEGKFLASVRAVAARYPEIAFEDELVDAAAARLVTRPESFGVIVTTNTFGDILAGVGAAACGSLGAGASLNVGPDVVVAEATHGSAPDLAGTGRANPVGLVRAAGLLLKRLGHRRQAIRIEQAVEATLAAGVGTPDLGGSATTQEVGAEILRRISP